MQRATLSRGDAAHRFPSARVARAAGCILVGLAVVCFFVAVSPLTWAASSGGPTVPVFPPDKPPPPGSLKMLPPPMPSNLSEFVADKSAAVTLGKALFWDEQAGSDGQACASCHFQAGADNRIKNALSPGLRNEQGGTVSTTFNVTASNRTAAGAPPGGGPNYTLKKADFPFHQLSDVNDRDSTVTFDTDDVTGSQGVFHRDFVSLLPKKKKADNCKVQPSFFGVQNLLVRQVEPRNTPTTINAIYNFRSFWDGRANNIFNGRDPFGPRDTTAGVDPLNSILAADGLGNLSPYPVAIPDASLASQAVGPTLSDFEMSCAGRVFEQVGQKLLRRQPLAWQNVDPTDSVLGMYSSDGKAKKGLAGLTITYDALIKKAFQPRFWNSNALTTEGYTQIEKNFSLFWGVSIMMYESTLVSDDTPFDRYISGDLTAMNQKQVDGFNQVFMNKGGCVFCHKGPEFTSAATSLTSVARPLGAQVERMTMADGTPALYDSGFYNIGVRPAVEDIGAGGSDPFGNPLSWTRQLKKTAAATGSSDAYYRIMPDLFNVFTCNFLVLPCVPVDSGERDAVDGSFKTPSLRNVELTGPYFHNGGAATLEQVVQFYNRGGDGRGPESANTTGYGPNPTNRAPAIQPLGLTAADQANLVAFLKSLTDERVRWERAPFDHPQLHIPNGASGDQNKVKKDGKTGYAVDDVTVLPAVGAGGRSVKNLPPLKPFEAGLK
jgi:cytochrome c peroxidase